MIEALNLSQSVAARMQAVAASPSVRPQTEETAKFNIDYAVPKDSVEIGSNLFNNPVAASSESNDASGERLSESEQQQVEELQERDAEVRTHEQAHVAAGGPYVSAPTYTEQRGPDGRSYAIGGEVSIDASPISGDPEASIAKLQTVIAAALAPMQPSAQDQAVANQAQQNLAQAYADQRDQKGNLGDGGEERGGALQSLLQLQENAGASAASEASTQVFTAIQAYQSVGA
ncbi:putative metalloprotease CJM1_0395 family protein [Pseudovibrio sp. SPO723]|uniref:putative metalloprotease CJM1_0395 family protein n=1 Tax=Nesiotobacter zosterae TaxID=392721 RepID=UPI0029C35848|nr:putative metalloprotease CJM1_0395 family protein [Pseudovibrio sp. SPO723]MDX5592760.1 putative metalloprotease CJM1_0395 family protein [Pseudovibrio sp. SPO723]